MPISRRKVIAGVLAAPAVMAGTGWPRPQPRTLKISHQFPGGTIDSGRFPRSAVPQIRRRGRKAHQRRAFDLSQLVADEDGGAILGGAQRRARSQPLPARLCRRRGARGQYRPDAVPGDAPTRRASPGRRRRSARSCSASLGQKGRQDHHLDLAGGRRAPRAPAPSSVPGDVKGLKIRGGSREMDMMLQGGRRHHRQRAVERDSIRRCRPAPATPRSPPRPA